MKITATRIVEEPSVEVTMGRTVTGSAPPPPPPDVPILIAAKEPTPGPEPAEEPAPVSARLRCQPQNSMELSVLMSW